MVILNSSRNALKQLPQVKITKPTLSFAHFRDLNKNHTYELLPGVHHYTIPRIDFVLFAEMKIYVKAVNQLGEATSMPLTLEPLSAGEM